MKQFAITASILLALVTSAAARNGVRNTGDLEASLRSEADAVSAIIKSLDATLVEATKNGLSERSVKAHAAAKQQYKQAEQLCRDRKYEACYQKLRQSKQSVMPAASELMSTGVSADIQLVVAKDLQAAAQRVAGVATLLAPSAPADAVTAYRRAEVLYKDGKALFEAGKHKEAFAKLEPALDELDIAIRATWAARPKAERK